jgi:hypothetical protein
MVAFKSSMWTETPDDHARDSLNFRGPAELERAGKGLEKAAKKTAIRLGYWRRTY